MPYIIGEQFSLRPAAYSLDWFLKNTVSYCYSLVLLKLTYSEWQIEDKSEIHLNVKIKDKGKKNNEIAERFRDYLKSIQVYKLQSGGEP